MLLCNRFVPVLNGGKLIFPFLIISVSYARPVTARIVRNCYAVTIQNAARLCILGFMLKRSNEMKVEEYFLSEVYFFTKTSLIQEVCKEKVKLRDFMFPPRCK